MRNIFNKNINMFAISHNKLFSSSRNYRNGTKKTILSLYTFNAEDVLKSNFTFYEKNLPLFYQWLSGFIDGEGSFQINPLKGKNGVITKFSFMFNINLHIDDLYVLRTISKLLGIGVVTTDIKFGKNLCTFRINKQSELLKLIRILIDNPIKGVKCLDFADFVKAYYLYFNRSSLGSPNPLGKEDEGGAARSTTLTPKVIAEILSIKNGMNKKRTNFLNAVVTLNGVFGTQESYNLSKIKVTDYWLLGLIEGEGSFHLIRSRIIPGFSLKMVLYQEPIMKAIKDYLVGRLDFDSNSLFKLEGSQLISINYVKSASANSKPQVFLAIENVRILYNYILPYLKSLPFLTNKFKDFNDFTLICYSVYYKTYKYTLIKDLILKLSNNMNNRRLSSYNGVTNTITAEEVGELLLADPICKPLPDGRLINTQTLKLESGLGGSVYEILIEEINTTHQTILVNSLEECASVTGVSRNLLVKRFSEVVDSSFVSEIAIENYKIKRIGVFLGNKV
uniref:LAGLIDADG endonuclease n=1 Tax=Juglanconis sp. TaxID=2041886 RepID=A0A291LIC3_9PEZI|nr:LAGLIDADG endonuclease [Juglanconis sp.]